MPPLNVRFKKYIVHLALSAKALYSLFLLMVVDKQRH